jgi:hypothetical protein
VGPAVYVVDSTYLLLATNYNLLTFSGFDSNLAAWFASGHDLPSTMNCHANNSESRCTPLFRRLLSGWYIGFCFIVPIYGLNLDRISCIRAKLLVKFDLISVLNQEKIRGVVKE